MSDLDSIPGLNTFISDTDILPYYELRTSPLASPIYMPVLLENLIILSFFSKNYETSIPRQIDSHKISHLRPIS